MWLTATLIFNSVELSERHFFSSWRLYWKSVLQKPVGCSTRHARYGGRFLPTRAGICKISRRAIYWLSFSVSYLSLNLALKALFPVLSMNFRLLLFIKSQLKKTVEWSLLLPSQLTSQLSSFNTLNGKNKALPFGENLTLFSSKDRGKIYMFSRPIWRSNLVVANQ